MYLAAALRNAARPPEALPKRNGFCINCQADLGGRLDLRACDSECAADYAERMTTTRKLAGIPARPTMKLRDEGSE